MTPLELTLEICPQGALETIEALEAVLEALTKVNALYYQRYPGGPCCPGCAGVEYDEPTAADYSNTKDRYPSVERMVVAGKARCGPLAAMEAARMRVLEGRDDAYVKVIPTDVAGVYHAVVETADGRKDPTAELIQKRVATGKMVVAGCGCEV